ncbi:ubiquitinyl hydrolase 1 [Trifolium repens]|nr:ubiquitinyl hydrolase 1 [Trifolium repens]
MKKKKHKIEQNTEALLDTTIVKVVRDEDLAEEQIGKDIYFDLVDPDKVRSFCVLGRLLKFSRKLCLNQKKQKVSAMDNVKHIRYPDVPSYFEYVHNGRVPFSPSDRESLDEQNKNIEAQQSKEGDIETNYDEGTNKSNTSKLVSINLE